MNVHIQIKKCYCEIKVSTQNYIHSPADLYIDSSYFTYSNWDRRNFLVITLNLQSKFSALM